MKKNKIPKYVKLIDIIGSGKTGKWCDSLTWRLGEVFKTALPFKLPVCNSWEECLSKEWYAHNFIEATKEEVLKYFPNEKFEEEFVLPEKWFIRSPLFKEVIDFVNISCSYDYNIYAKTHHPHFENLKFHNGHTKIQKGYTEITFEQFKKYVLKMENKKIIGYKLIKRIPGLQVGAVFTSKIDNQWVFETYEYNNEEIQDTEFFEPVYEYEFKIGDWIYIKSCDYSITGILSDSGKQHSGANVGDIVKIEGITFKGGFASKLDPRYFGNNFNLRAKDFRLATKEEIEKATEQVISMNGKFDLTIRNRKVYHKSEDITSFVNGIGADYYQRIGLFNRKYSNYDFVIKDMILSKTGCQSQETYLSDWLKIYELIK